MACLSGVYEKIAEGLPKDVTFPEQGTPEGDYLRRLVNS